MVTNIRFKGITRTDGIWVEGDLTGEDTIHIEPPFIDHEYGGYEWWGYEVIPETVCFGIEYNGVWYFENDIYSNGAIDAEIRFSIGMMEVLAKFTDQDGYHSTHNIHWLNISALEFTGNKFDYLTKQLTK